MFRKGAFIDQPAQANADPVHVTERSQFSRRQVVELVHGPGRDGVPPDQGPDGFWSEQHTILSILNDSSGPGGTLVFGTNQGSETLSHSYGPDPSISGVMVYLYDGVGVVTNNSSDFFGIRDDLYVKNLYDTTFVEFLAAETQNVAHVPFEALFGDTNHGVAEGGVTAHFAMKWFENATRDPLQPMTQLAKPNHQHITGGSMVPDTPIGGGQFDVHLGDTVVQNGTNFTWIWTKRIENQFANNAEEKAKDEVIAHELAHQWHVNPPSLTTKGHCSRNMKNNPALLCTMHGL